MQRSNDTTPEGGLSDPMSPSRPTQRPTAETARRSVHLVPLQDRVGQARRVAGEGTKLTKFR